MNDEVLAARPAGRWALLWAMPERLVEQHPGVLLGVGMGLVLLGYAVPLVFPVATIVLSYQMVDALVAGGWEALAGQGLQLCGLLFCATLSVSLWRLRVAEPGGEPLMQAQAPALFAVVDDVRTTFQAPPITDIHLTDTAQVSVRRIPRTGYPVAFRYVLLAGLPALQCLTEDQFKCMLASALGGLSVVRADTAGWIDQLTQTWQQYRQAVAGQWTPAAMLYRLFLAGFMPVLGTLTERLDAGRQLRRDRFALELADDDLVADTMAGEVVMQRFLASHYWPTVYAAAEHSATPSFKVFRNLETIFRRRVDSELIQVWLREAFVGKWRSDAQDVGLRIRLNEIGHIAVQYRQPEEVSAAQTLLGASHQWIIDRCDARWADEHGEEWSAHHTKSQQQFGRLEQLRAALQQRGLFGEEAMHYAALVKRYGTEQEALAAYERILELNPDDARINFGVGKFLLSCRDARGVRILEHAMSLDKRYVEPACRLISGFTVERRVQDTVRNRVLRDEGERDIA
ncbi:MAG: hypothetical protein HZB57_04045 [Gammaproteobacteria bacterium]|nr:hypothetical protein [Gammaproteobacteria bacterium]